MIVAIILVIVRPIAQKIIGIYLVVISVPILVILGYNGFVPFAFILSSGIEALRQKQSKNDKYDKQPDDIMSYYNNKSGPPLK